MKAVLYTHRPEQALASLVHDVPGLEWVLVGSAEECGRKLADAEILLMTGRLCTPEMGETLRRAPHPRLKWFHLLSAGVEKAVLLPIPDGVRFSSSAGANAPTNSEHVVLLLLAVLRKLRDCVEAMQAREWADPRIRRAIVSLTGKTVCLVGMGAIAAEVARKLKAFDCRVIAVSRWGAAGGNFDAVYRRDEMHRALAEADAVIVATSGDAESRGLVDAAALAAMKPGAVLVNAARGYIVDEAALGEALRSGRLAAAGLDVAASEPLAADSPLWTLPNVLITPHVASAGSSGYAGHRSLFVENLARFRAGRRLINELDRQGKRIA